MKISKRFFKSSKSCAGFTLTEVLVSTALTGLILSQVGAVLVTSQRVMEATMADVELAVKSHELREKLFYHVYDDGGLMDACESGIEFTGKKGSDGITFRPKRGQNNKVQLDSNKRLKANNQKKDKWLECGTMFFQGTNVFDDSSVATGGVVKVNLNLAFSVGNRTYTQKHVIQTVIMNEE